MRYSLYLKLIIPMSGFVAGLLLLSGCASTSPASTPTASPKPLTYIGGTVYATGILSGAKVTVFDLSGQSVTTFTDAKGVYQADVSTLTPPLLVHALEAGQTNFADNSKPRGISVAALVTNPVVSDTTVNVNAFSDRVVSDIAKTLGFKGPAGLIRAGKTSGVKPEDVSARTAAARALILKALVAAKVPDAETWDPVSTPWSKEAESVLGLVRSNRGYDAASGQVGDTMLFDLTFHPISAKDTLDFERASKEQELLADKSVIRVFIAADSTCSFYESERAPRSGWGQTFQSKFASPSKVLVINSAQSGRSSRTFINEGWFRMIEPLMLPGDYLIIQFGHNDEKAGSVPSLPRDTFDIAATATYPNDVNGRVQGDDAMSFQRWLEKYIASAKAKDVTPILLTPTTRAQIDSDKKTGVFPLLKSVHYNDASNSSAKYLGDYSQTIRDTAKLNNVACIDIDAKTQAMYNAAGEPGWKQLWLAIDPAKYPFYKTGLTGNIDTPDNTHFQIAGASKVASLVIDGIKATPSLAKLAALAK